MKNKYILFILLFVYLIANVMAFIGPGIGGGENYDVPQGGGGSYEVGDTAVINYGGGGAPTVIVQDTSFCGDGTCQSDGNQEGVKEDYFNCSQDCSFTTMPNFKYFMVAFGILLGIGIFASFFSGRKEEDNEEFYKTEEIKQVKKVDNRSIERKLREGTI